MKSLKYYLFFLIFLGYFLAFLLFVVLFKNSLAYLYFLDRKDLE